MSYSCVVFSQSGKDAKSFFRSCSRLSYFWNILCNNLFFLRAGLINYSTTKKNRMYLRIGRVTESMLSLVRAEKRNLSRMHLTLEYPVIVEKPAVWIPSSSLLNLTLAELNLHLRKICPAELQILVWAELSKKFSQLSWGKFFLSWASWAELGKNLCRAELSWEPIPKKLSWFS